MDTLVSLRVFAAIAELRSFVAAAERLRLSPAMASKHIQHLEGRVGARLLNRTSRKVSLTEAGVRYLERARAFIEGLDDVEAQIGATALAPRGTLKASLPVWLANPSFAKLVAAYRLNYPDVRLDLDFEGRMVNLVEEGFDLALRGTAMPDEALIARKIADIPFLLVAAPAFLDRTGRPVDLADLEGRPFLAYSPVTRSGRLMLGEGSERREVQFDPVLQSRNETMLLLAAREGMGLTFMPRAVVSDDLAERRLEHVLPATLRPSAPIYAVYPNRAYLPAKVRTFLDFLLDNGSIFE